MQKLKVWTACREAPNIPHLSRCRLVCLGSKLCQQHYFELDWASLRSYRKILSHRRGIYCIPYTRDGKSRHASEAGEHLGFQSVQTAQRGTAEVTFSSVGWRVWVFREPAGSVSVHVTDYHTYKLYTYTQQHGSINPTSESFNSFLTGAQREGNFFYTKGNFTSLCEWWQPSP